MKKLKIVLGDLSYDTPLLKGNLYVPLGVGYIASYASKIYSGQVDIKIFKYPSALLDYATSEKPDLIGFSHYFWNSDLNRKVTRRLRRELGSKVKIVWGGPSIDSDHGVLLRTCLDYSDVDYFVPNEGEIGFANIVGALLSGAASEAALDGVAFARDGSLISGKAVGLSADLATIGSPYLDGFIDPFMNDKYLPLLQTSRLCPYSCAYCASGKNVGKLRGFPMDQVKAEIDYIAKRYQNLPNHMLYISDDNFGILERDVELAQYVRSVSQSVGWPKKVKYYSDKKFGQTSRDVQANLGDISFHGVMLSMQTENPETLKIIKRKNMSIDQFKEAISWARSRELPLSTELIFGLPMETRKSFLGLIDKCIELNFDYIACYNLIMCDGIELNRPVSRQQHAIKTKFRHVSGSYCHLGEDFVAETEEVVVGANGYDMDDFKFFRIVSLLLFCTSYLRMHILFFGYLRELGISFSTFTEKLFDIVNAAGADEELVKFISELNVAIEAELFDTREDLIDHLRRISEQADGEIPEPFKINPEFGCRMAQQSGGWVSGWLRRALGELLTGNDRQEVLDKADFLLKVGTFERVAGGSLFNSEPVETEFDVLAWSREGFGKPLESYRIPAGRIVFTPSSTLVDMRTSLSKEYDSERVEQELYENLRQFKLSANDCIYLMSIAE